jgi:hypothetical protein
MHRADPKHPRSGPRRILRTAAVLDLPGEPQRTVTTWDLGAGGLSMLSSSPISPGRTGRVTFEVPLTEGGRSVTATVKVVYSSFSGMGDFKVGTVFTTLDDESAKAINAFAAPA